MTVRVRASPGAVLCACLALAACGSDSRKSGGASATRSIPTPLATGALAPAYAARSLAGDSVAFGTGADGLTLVNVWALWCTSCREEFAELERMRVAHGGAGLRVVAVSVDQGADEKVLRFAEAQGAHFPVIHDRAARITPMYGVVGLPTTYLIAKDGKIAWMLTGSFLEEREALERAIVAQLRTAGSDTRQNE